MLVCGVYFGVGMPASFNSEYEMCSWTLRFRFCNAAPKTYNWQRENALNQWQIVWKKFNVSAFVGGSFLFLYLSRSNDIDTSWSWHNFTLAVLNTCGRRSECSLYKYIHWRHHKQYICAPSMTTTKTTAKITTAAHTDSKCVMDNSMILICQITFT